MKILFDKTLTEHWDHKGAPIQFGAGLFDRKTNDRKRCQMTFLTICIHVLKKAKLSNNGKTLLKYIRLEC